MNYGLILKNNCTFGPAKKEATENDIYNTFKKPLAAHPLIADDEPYCPCTGKFEHRQARQIFDKTYNMVFGPQGCNLTYSVNIIGVYKTQGTIWMKGKKQKFVESRYSAWSDGKDFHRVDKKKKTIEIHNPNSAKRDKYASKFKFMPDNYTYHITAKGNDFIITLDAKKGVDGVKHAKVVIDKRTREPKSLEGQGDAFLVYGQYQPFP